MKQILIKHLLVAILLKKIMIRAHSQIEVMVNEKAYFENMVMLQRLLKDIVRRMLRRMGKSTLKRGKNWLKW